MAQANVLVIVDTKATLQGTVTVYLVDDDPSSSGQGSINLVTSVTVDSRVVWKPVSINGTDIVKLIRYEDKGPANFFSTTPAAVSGDPDSAWDCVVGNSPVGTTSNYGFYFTINGSGNYNFDPEIKIKP